MGKVVNQGNAAAGGADDFQPAFDAGKAFQRFGGRQRIQTGFGADGNCGQRVADVESAEQIETEGLSAEIVFYAVGQAFDAVGKEVRGRIFDREGRFAVVFEVAGQFAVAVDDQRAFGVVGKSLEITDQVFH